LFIVDEHEFVVGLLLMNILLDAMGFFGASDQVVISYDMEVFQQMLHDIKEAKEEMGGSRKMGDILFFVTYRIKIILLVNINVNISI
jgi:transposase